MMGTDDDRDRDGGGSPAPLPRSRGPPHPRSRLSSGPATARSQYATTDRHRALDDAPSRSSTPRYDERPSSRGGAAYYSQTVAISAGASSPSERAIAPPPHTVVSHPSPPLPAACALAQTRPPNYGKSPLLSPREQRKAECLGNETAWRLKGWLHASGKVFRDRASSRVLFILSSGTHPTPRERSEPIDDPRPPLPHARHSLPSLPH